MAFQNKILTNVIEFGSVIHERIFNDRINSETITFLQNMSYVAVGTTLATLFSFMFNVLGGRILGPVEYGLFTLINSVAMFLYVPMLFGISTAMIKYNSEKTDLLRQKKIISTSYILVLIFTLLSLFVYLQFSTEISNIFSITTEYLYLSIFIAILFVFYTLTTNTLRSLHKMKAYSVFRLMYSILLFFSFIIFFIIGHTTFKLMILSTYIAYAVIGICILIYMRRYIICKFDKYWAKTIMHYSLYDIFSGVSFILYTNVDKVLISKYMTIQDVGIYNAYILSSISFIGLLSSIIITVLFPTASKYKNKQLIINKIHKLVPYIFLIGLPSSIIAELLILSIYGKNYPLNYSLILMFAITSILFMIYDLYIWTFNSIGIDGVKITMRGSMAIAFSNILLNIFMIPIFGLHGAIGATAISYLIGLKVIFTTRKVIN